jgi:hypothetical protein
MMPSDHPLFIKQGFDAKIKALTTERRTQNNLSHFAGEINPKVTLEPLRISSLTI